MHNGWSRKYVSFLLGLLSGPHKHNTLVGFSSRTKVELSKVHTELRTASQIESKNDLTSQWSLRYSCEQTVISFFPFSPYIQYMEKLLHKLNRMKCVGILYHFAPNTHYLGTERIITSILFHSFLYVKWICEFSESHMEYTMFSNHITKVKLMTPLTSSTAIAKVDRRICSIIRMFEIYQI